MVMRAKQILETVSDGALLHYIRWGWLPREGTDGKYYASENDPETLKAYRSAGGNEDIAREVAKERNLL